MPVCPECLAAMSVKGDVASIVHRYACPLADALIEAQVLKPTRTMVGGRVVRLVNAIEPRPS